VGGPHRPWARWACWGCLACAWVSWSRGSTVWGCRLWCSKRRRSIGVPIRGAPSGLAHHADWGAARKFQGAPAEVCGSRASMGCASRPETPAALSSEHCVLGVQHSQRRVASCVASWLKHCSRGSEAVRSQLLLPCRLVASVKRPQRRLARPSSPSPLPRVWCHFQTPCRCRRPKKGLAQGARGRTGQPTP
jgi:hypothetical protein